MLLPATCECSGWRKTYHKPSVLWQFRSKNRVAGETGVNSWGKTHLGNMINQWFFRYQIFRHTHSLKPFLWGWYVFWKTRSAWHVHVSRGSLYIPLHQDENMEPLLVKNWWFSRSFDVMICCDHSHRWFSSRCFDVFDVSFLVILHFSIDDVCFKLISEDSRMATWKQCEALWGLFASAAKSWLNVAERRTEKTYSNIYILYVYIYNCIYIYIYNCIYI